MTTKPTTVLVTGADGFIGRNLRARLRFAPGATVLAFDVMQDADELSEALAVADAVVHLAGVNRPRHEAEFVEGNVQSTAAVCDGLRRLGRAVPVVLSSSTQAVLDNAYGRSKLQAEEVVRQYARDTGARAAVFRLSNVFGKWCRPNYNSVVATFCYNTAHGLPLTISDPGKELLLMHVDDVAGAMVSELENAMAGAPDAARGFGFSDVTPVHPITLGRLADTIRGFGEARQTLQVPRLDDPLTYKLYGTYLSYLDIGNLSYSLPARADARGALAEFIKSSPAGQIFVSRTLPGVTRGNHFHHLKAEKFLVLEGEAVIRFRALEEAGSPAPLELGDPRPHVPAVAEYRVSGTEFRVVEIPPGYTHSIENVGQGVLVTLFWASEVFDPRRPDTVPEAVR